MKMTGSQIWKRKYTEPEWLVPPFLLKRGVTMLAAAPGAGKSYFALGAAKSVAGGQPFLGSVPHKLGKVYYLAGEDDDVRMQLRMRQQGWTAAERENFVAEFDPPPATGSGLQKIAEDVADVQAEFLIVDPLISLSTGKTDFNKAGEMGALMKAFKTIARDEPQVSILICHHTRKTTRFSPGGNLDEDALGSRALGALVDIRMMIDHPRTALNGRIHLGGKDLQRQVIDARLDIATGTWRKADEMADESSLRARIVADLTKSGCGSATEVADRLDEDRGNVSKLLYQLFNEGKATRSEKGRAVIYCLAT